MKHILVLYYTQTGQAKEVLDAILKPFQKNERYKIHYELIRPEIPFPYPWKYTEFFDAFPENVQNIPCRLRPLNIDLTIDYDLVFIAYQPWFLNICRPVNSFLMSNEARKLLKNKPVITIINCRNMWLNAQEKMKMRLTDLSADLVGNMSFVDRSANLVSLITVLAYELGGVKDRFLRLFPKYGIKAEDLIRAEEIGNEIQFALGSKNFGDLQLKIIEKDLVPVKPELLLLEGRGKVLFPLYASFISKKGDSGSKARRTRVKIFGIVLPTAILILSPLITVFSRMVPLLGRKKIKREIAYYQQNSLRKA